jgi:hypothetical protein
MLTKLDPQTTTRHTKVDTESGKIHIKMDPQTATWHTCNQQNFIQMHH